MKHINKMLRIAFVLLILLSTLSFPANASVLDYDYYIKDNTIVLTKYNGSDEVIVVPSEIDGKAVVQIEGTFCNNKKIEKVILPEGISIVGEKAFYGCSNLNSVMLPDSVEIIENYAFAYCGLQEIVLPINTHYINEGAFLGCGNLTAIISHAEPITTDGKALFIGQFAFEASKIRVIKTKYTPYFYDNSFSGVCYFTDSFANYAIYRSDFLNAIIEPLRNASPIESALLLSSFVCILVLLFFACIYIVRGILILLGKDKLNNYKKYSKQIFHEMQTSKYNQQTVNYKPICFFRDKLFSVLSKIVITLSVFIYIVFLFYISTTNHWDMNPFLNATICVLGGVFVSVTIIAFVVWLSYKIRSIISDHREADIAKVRIRKIDGGKRYDQ